MAFTVQPSMSATQLATFHTCRLQWYFKHVKRYRTGGRVAALDLGSAIHEALAAHYRGKKDPYRVFDDYIANLVQQVERLGSMGGDVARGALQGEVQNLYSLRLMGRSMLDSYFRQYAHERFKVMEVEKTIIKKIPGTDWTFWAIVDVLVSDEKHGDKIYVVDHKTFTRFYAGYQEKDHQFTSYKWAAQDLVGNAEEIAGVIYNGIRKVEPGSHTKAALFERHVLDINDHQVKIFLRRLRSTIKMLTDGRFAIYPEPSSMSCSYCPYKDPCTLYMKGEDYEFLLKNMFEVAAVHVSEGGEEDE